MIQINIPNDRVPDFAEQLRGQLLGFYNTERRGLSWFPATSITHDGDKIVLTFVGEDWSDTVEDFVEVEITVRRPLAEGRTAVYVDEALAEEILAAIEHPAPAQQSVA